jgi:hypothetical protein
MTRKKTGIHCAECGAAARGKYCASCGATLGGDARDASLRGRSPSARVILIVAVCVLSIGAFVAGQSTGVNAPAVGIPLSSVENLAALSPEERASRLFDRVMQHGEAGRMDSARYFAPLAVQAFDALGVRDLHAQYDIGMIHAIVGDTAAARAAADAILRQRPTHLLGLALAMRSAPSSNSRQAFAKRLLAATAAEEKSPLAEYGDHRRDLDGAIANAKQQPR